MVMNMEMSIMRMIIMMTTIMVIPGGLEGFTEGAFIMIITILFSTMTSIIPRV